MELMEEVALSTPSQNGHRVKPELAAAAGPHPAATRSIMTITRVRVNSESIVLQDAIGNILTRRYVRFATPK
jgi:hypothetical protein